MNSFKDLFTKDEIFISDFYRVIRHVLLSSLKLILSITIIILTISVIYFYNIPVEYESKSIVYIETANPTPSSGNIMKDMLLGEVRSSGTSSVSPDKYKAILSSKVFLNELIDIKFPLNQNSKDSVSLFDYFSNSKKEVKEFSQEALKVNKSKSANSSTLASIDKEIVFSNQIPPIVEFDDSRLNVFSIVEKRVKLEIKDNAVTVLVKMPKPFLSAIVGKVVLERLLIYISELATHKQNRNIDYLSNQMYDAELNYKLAQRKYAGYKDNSLGVIFESSQINNQILNNNMTVTFNIYNQVAVQLEQAKLELKKETPIFSILDPITIPSTPIEPNLIKHITITIGAIITAFFLIILYKSL